MKTGLSIESTCARYNPLPAQSGVAMVGSPDHIGALETFLIVLMIIGVLVGLFSVALIKDAETRALEQKEAERKERVRIAELAEEREERALDRKRKRRANPRYRELLKHRSERIWNIRERRLARKGQISRQPQKRRMLTPAEREQRAEAKRQAQLEEHRRREEESAAETRETHEERLRTLVLKYERFTDFENADFLEAYARQRWTALLGEEARIQREYQALHNPPEFLELLKSREPSTYERAIWKMRALAFAKRLEITEPSPKEPTQNHRESRRAEKVTEFTEEALDRMALKEAELEMREKGREMLRRHDLDFGEEESHLDGLIPSSGDEDEEVDGDRTL